MPSVPIKEFIGLTAAGLGGGALAGSRLSGENKSLNVALSASGGAVIPSMVPHSVKNLIARKLFKRTGKGFSYVGLPLAALGIATGMFTANQLKGHMEHYDKKNIEDRTRAVMLQKKAEIKEAIKKVIKKPTILDIEIPWNLEKGIQALAKSSLL